MIIRLPWINPIDTNRVPSNFDELVKESFLKFTKGTSKEYMFVDKLLYIDNLRKHYLRFGDSQSSVENLIKERCMYRLREYGELPTTEEILDVEFMEYCYDEGFRPFKDTWDKCSSSRNDAIMKLILRIIQVVVNIEEKR